MIFSQQDEFQPIAVKLWNAMRYYSDVRSKIGSLSFCNMRNTPGLQAADLLAYELRHYYHLRKNKPGMPCLWAFRQIVLHQRNIHQSFMLKYLPDWYIEAQAVGRIDEIMKQKRVNNDMSFIKEMTPDIKS